MDKPVWRVFADSKSLAQSAAELFLHAAKDAIAKRGRFSVALSGGNTPRETHREIARLSLPWDQVFFYWGDERAVPPTDVESNYRMAKETLLDPIRATHVFRMKADQGEKSLEQAKAEYARIMGELPEGRLDLAIQGMGDDGHTASLFPGRETLVAKTDVVVDPVGQKGIPRISLSLPMINRSRTVLFLVEGAAKAEVLEKVLIKREKQYPAARVNPGEGQLFWFLDRAAAAKL
jgi:6-phosphogluconolactonase